MVFSVSSAYTLTGDATKTLNNLTNTASTGSSSLSDLSKTNYLDSSTAPNESHPNADNQLIFMNQPLSWWLSSLNSGAVKYTPYSNNVNWAYIDSEKNSYHINITISNLLIPNKTLNVSRVPGSMESEITFEPKFGLSRVDKHKM
jgi:hypothetical protein